ncbi:amine dehydrogenase large subunit [uncultured Caulobacter sp.]|uniref:amine dehydrogenase large subunit n=1 Tax=uncultured Caulobacter sp. TaxID=158749 RepID=UPI0026189239|nr:amine dehydrogenase large subunit [uncultured Caulobacter sp.]
MSSGLFKRLGFAYGASACVAALALSAAPGWAADAKAPKTPAKPAEAAAAPLPPVLPEEEADTAVLATAGPHRLFLFDPYYYAGAHVIEGDDPLLSEKGLAPAARNAGATLSRDGGKIYFSETYWSRGDRGDRQDLLTVYDGRTLALEKEIPLPSRLLVVPKTNQVATSEDGALAYAYAMAPASQVHVVDLAAGKVIGSVDMPGCSLAFPFGARSFASLCGDGTVGVATVGPAAEAAPKFSKPFFDADNDPVFENSFVDRATGEAFFLSFTGKIYPAKLAGAAPVVDKPWSINVAAGFPAAGAGVQELAWRPGGGQVMAFHRKNRQLYVLMHAGNYWTHKVEGTEVWVLDVDKHSLIKRISLAAPAKGIAVTQDDQPLLYAYDSAPMSLAVYNAKTGEVTGRRKIGGIIGMVPGL